MEQRWKPNVTVAAVIEQGGRYLLIEEHTPEGLRLNNPAGHLDLAESPQEGVVREVLEETACVFTPASVVGVYLGRYQRPARGEDITYLRIAFAGTVSDPLPGRGLDQGIVGRVWMTLDEVRASTARHRSAMVLQCIEDHAAGRNHPLALISTEASVYLPTLAP